MPTADNSEASKDISCADVALAGFPEMTARHNSVLSPTAAGGSTAQMRYFSNIMLIVTENCNLRCSYCYEQEKPYSAKKRMSWPTAQKAIDQFFQQVPEHADRTSITFFGGEPTLEFDLIKKVIAYSYSHRTIGHYRGKDYNYVINTNGTLLSEEMYQLFGRLGRKLNLRVSADGFREGHDITRKTVDGKGSWRLVGKNLTYHRNLKERFGVDVYLISTINKSSYRDIYLNFTKLHEYTGMHLGCLFVHEDKWEKKDFEILKEQILLLKEYSIRHNVNMPLCRTGGRPNISDPDNDDTFHSICGAGVSSYTVNTTGDIFACHRANYHGFEDDFRLGSIDTGLNIDKRLLMYEINNLKTLPLKCLKCLPVIREKCHLCLASNKEAYGGFHTVADAYCSFMNELHQLVVDKERQMRKAAGR